MHLCGKTFANASTAGIGGAAQPLPIGNGGESRNPGKRLKNGLLAIFEAGFSAKNREFLRKHWTRPPWRCLFASKNGKMFFY